MTAPACAGMFTDMFYEQTDMYDPRRALSVCAVCPVRRECLREAILNDERYGIWGGTTAEQRARLRKGRGDGLSH